MPLLPRNVVGKLRDTLREHGVRETVERSGLWLAERLLSSTLHRHSRVSLATLEDSAASMHFSVGDLMETYQFSEGGKAVLSQIKSEYQVLSAELAVRYREGQLTYPQCYAIEHGSAFLLYALVRSLRPGIVLETGVANGHSTFYITTAMRANDHGLLHSIDCSPNVGSLLADDERERWTLHVLDKRNLKKSFLQILRKLPPPDLFLHDSDHTYAWQSFELEAALKSLAPGGIVASDDCDSCHAFLDVCLSANVRSVVLVERRKVFGLIFSQSMKELQKSGDSVGGVTRSDLIRV